MKQGNRQDIEIRRLSLRFLTLAAALLALGLLAAAPASATYEQTGIFAGAGTPPKEAGVFPEEVQLGGVGGMAINRTGAGGVPAGTIYAAHAEGGVARFNPEGEFREAWFGDASGFHRCGPDGEAGLSVCAPVRGGPQEDRDVEVDQGTGYVYVYQGAGSGGGTTAIIVYSAKGSKITEFGQFAGNEDVAATPGLLHSSLSIGGLALDNSDGTVYVFDKGRVGGEEYGRIATFKPQSPGDYQHYVYAGQEHDIWAGAPKAFPSFPTGPVADDAGHLYIAESQYVAELDPSQPNGAPICQLNFKKGGIRAITVNPLSEEVFFASLKDRKIYQAKCNGEGEFVQTGSFAYSPSRIWISGMALNPERQLNPERPAGVLYAGSPSGEGGNEGEVAQGFIFAPPVSLAPKVESESVSHVTATTVRLEAQINPKGSLTRYAFQYLSEAAFKEAGESFTGASEVPLGGVVLGEGQKALAAAAPLAGLQPDTAYRYRVIATSRCNSEHPEEACEDIGGGQSFRTFPAEAPGLPDQRAWELVSPAQKNGGQVFPAEPLKNSCYHVLVECKPGFAYEKFPIQVAADGNSIVYRGSPFSPAEGPVYEDQYIAHRSEETGWQSTSLTPTQLDFLGGAHAAYDPTLGKGVLYQSNPLPTPEAPSEYANIYAQPTADPGNLQALLSAEPPHRPARGEGRFALRFAGASSDLSRVFFEANDALTEATLDAPEAEDGGPNENNLYEWSTGELRLVNVLPGNMETKAGAQFARDNSAPFNRLTLTGEISKDGSRVFWSDEAGQLYVREDGEATQAIPGPGKFRRATPDGSKVLLNNGSLYDLESETTTDLTGGEGGFVRLLGQSEDLSHIYFLDTAVLDEVPNEHGETAKAGDENVYSWTGGSARFVAKLAATDVAEWDNSLSIGRPEASPDGRWLAFMSKAPLSGPENIGLCNFFPEPKVYGLGPCSEVFLYDSATEKLTCASCNPTGMSPLGLTWLREVQTAAPQPQNRFLTDSGRLYFDTQDSLVVADTNEGVEDVYQYEPEGVGSCKGEGGCVNLISAGREAVDSNLVAIDEEGGNVFFTTRDQLVAKDKDDLYDLYDARVEGGIPAETETARGECQGEACVAPLSPPNDPTPASSSFEGAGNVDERKASKKHKHKKKHAKKHRQNGRHAHGRTNHNRGGAK